MFIQENLYTAAAIFNSTSYGSAPAVHTYTSATDTLADISSFDYFPDHFNVDPLRIRANDILFIIASDFNLITRITSVVPVNLVSFVDFPTNIVTDTDRLISTSLQGIWASPIPIMIDAYQLNKLCILTFPTVSQASIGGATEFTLSAPLPAALLPQYTTAVDVKLTDNSLPVDGALTLHTSGSLFWTKDDGSLFSSTGNAGFFGFAAAYKTV